MADFISISEAAERLGVTPRRAQELARLGQVEALKVSGVWLVDAESVDRRMKTINKAGGRPKRGEGRNESVFMLMNRSHEIAEVVYDSVRKEFTLLGGVLDEKRAPVGIAPAGFGISLPDFNRWWRDRGIPGTRDDLDQVLREAGARVPEDLLQRNLGLSLSDQYWIRPQGSGLAWSEVNFFQNDFEEMAQRTVAAASEPAVKAHPANTSDGNLQKTWIVRDGKRLLRKGGRHNNQEPFNEVVATALHRRLLDGRDYVPYELDGSGGEAYSLCADFVSDEEEYIPAMYVMNVLQKAADKNDYLHYLACCEALGAQGAKGVLDRMIVCDDIIANFDRHFRNFGVVRNVETLECRPAPIFDSGSSLWCNAPMSEFSGGRCSFKGRQFYANPGRQLLLVDDYSWFDTAVLEGFSDEAMGILAQNEAIGPRLALIRSSLERRIERMVDIVEWG